MLVTSSPDRLTNRKYCKHLIAINYLAYKALPSLIIGHLMDNPFWRGIILLNPHNDQLQNPSPLETLPTFQDLPQLDTAELYALAESVNRELWARLHQVNTIGFNSTGEKDTTLSDEAYEYIVLQYNQQIHLLWDLKGDIQTQLLFKLEQRLPSLPSSPQ